MAHFWLIFVYLAGRNKQNGTKNGMENDVKNSYYQTPGKGNLEKCSKNVFSLQAHCQKDEKCSFLGSIFAKERLRFHFSSIFLSFFFHSQFPF